MTDTRKYNPPEGVSGDWRIRHTVPDGFAVLERFNPNPKPTVAGVPPRQWDWFMSTEPGDVQDHDPFLEKIKPGDSVVLTGLGMGTVAIQAAEAGAGEITVIENCQNVIDLTEKWLRKRIGFHLVVADADSWEPPALHLYDHCFLDHFLITPEGEYLASLKSKYGRFCKTVDVWKPV